MALQGNPFLGKLKVPAPDLSRIPDSPFEGAVGGSRTLSTSKPLVSHVSEKSDLSSDGATSSNVSTQETDSTKSFAERPVLTSKALPQVSQKKQKPESAASIAATPTLSNAKAEAEPNRFQTVSNGFSNGFQTVSAIGFNRLQDKSETVDRNRLKPNGFSPNRFQTVSEPVSAIGFKLPPIGELAVLRYLADRESPFGAPIPVRRREVAMATAQTLAGVKTALIRLSKTLLLELVEFKCGKTNGFTSYRLTAQARAVLASKEASASMGFNRFQTVSEPVSIGFSSSSSFLDLTKLKTTTSEPEVSENTDRSLSPEWARVNISCVSGIGFTKHQLAQLIRDGHLTPKDVENSLAHFAFAYERGDLKNIGKPLAYLMSILRSPSNVPRPDGYETPLEASRRINLEHERRDEERRQAEEKELQDLGFAAWRRELSIDEINAIVPEVVRHLSKGREMSLRAHFEENIWPEKRSKMFGKFESERVEISRPIDLSIGEAGQ